MKPFNLYRSDGDREVWDRIERAAEVAGLSVSAYVIAVLREKHDLRRVGAETDDREGK